jgi:hypothetical protein
MFTNLLSLPQTCRIFLLPNILSPYSNSSLVLRLFIVLIVFFLSSSHSLSWSLHPSHINSMAMHGNKNAISDFRLLNRITLMECPETSSFLQVNVTSNSKLSDEEYLTVTVSVVLFPSYPDWVAMILPSHSK